MKKLFVISLLVLSVIITGRASHIVGGEFSMAYAQKGYNYNLNLNLYFDDVNANGGLGGLADPEIWVAIYDKGTDELISSHEMILESTSEFVPYINPDCQIKELRTRILRYRETLTLSPDVYNNTEGYYVVYDRCCRNSIISNINDPDLTGMMFYMHFPSPNPNGVSFLNNTPKYNFPFAEYACVGQNFQYDFSAVDTDGDSLVYYMDDPYDGNMGQNYSFNSSPFPHPAPFATVDWLPGFNANNAVPGSPTMSVNSSTGWLNLTPTTEGLFVFSVTVDEYRNGIKIGSVKRDYQLLVQPPCDPNVPPFMQFLHSDSTVYVEGDTVFVDGNVEHEYLLCFTDSIINGKSSNVNITASQVNFNSNYLTLEDTRKTFTTDGDTVKALLNWDGCEDSEGEVWELQFIANDDGCVLPMSDTLNVRFVIEPKDNIDPFVYTSLSLDTIKLEVWNDTSFTVFGEDLDNDLIVLEGKGVGFSMNDVGMSFPKVSSDGIVSSSFYWYVECEDLKQQYFPIDFTVDDNWCGEPNDSTIRKVIEVFEVPLEPQNFQPINVFTPNGDGINDYFEMPELPIEKCDGEFLAVEVYNRWGARAFRAETRDFKWDGDNLSVGVYFYHINYENREYRGWVQILR